MKTKTINLLKAGGLLVFVVSFLVATSAFAVTGSQTTDQETILLSPTSKRYQLAAGSTTTDSFKIVNDGTTDFGFVTYARPYSVTGIDYAPDFENKAQNADAYKWIQFDQPSYQIKSHQSIDVKYTIRVPSNATPGGHYGVLFAETQPNTDQISGNAILRKKRVGAILYITVKGDTRLAGSFKGTDVPFLQVKAPLKVRQKVANSGNTDFQVNASVQISDIFGGLKYKSSKDVTVLPSTTRSIVNDWASPAWIGVYKVEQTAKFLDTNKTSTNYVLLVPLWTYLLLALLVGGRVLYAVVHRQKK
jgi:hypothetical protein